MLISDRQRAEFTELFIRNCYARDSISVLRGIPVLQSLGASPEVYRKVWNLCDSTRQGRLRFGEFLVACMLSTQCGSVASVPGIIPQLLAPLLDTESPVPTGPAADGEGNDIMRPDGIASPTAADALELFNNEYQVIQVASVRIIALLAFNECNHSILRSRCAVDVLLRRLVGVMPSDAVRNVAITLCCLSSTDSKWLSEVINYISLILTDERTSTDVSALLLGAVANTATGPQGIERLVNHEPVSDEDPSLVRIIKCMGAVRESEWITECVRLFLNIAIVGPAGRATVLESGFVQAMFADSGQLLKHVQPTGGAYLMELLRILVDDASMCCSLVRSTEMIESLYECMDASTLFHETVGLRLTLLLAKVC